MISFLQIENFKSLRKVALSMSKLNLLFGMNGMGKSSVLQALLLLRQSARVSSNGILNALYTNGDILKLGTGKDVFCQNADDDIIRICLKYYGKDMIDYSFRYDGNNLIDRMDRVYSSNSLDITGSTYFESGETLSLFGKKCFYLGAEHLGPQKQYDMENSKNNTINPFGSKGEYVVPYLAEYGEVYHVPAKLCNEKGKTDRLIDQISAWMSEVSPGIRLSAELIPAIEKVRLQIGYEGSRLTSDPFSPVNVGFGIPYVLPLIVLLLTSDSNTLLLLENPESHLHPKGQAMIAKMLSIAAANGAQIVCESHSDHIINGIRVAIKKGMLSKDDVQVNYFDKNVDQESKVTSISVDANGNLSDYPIGLLDEWGNLMAELL